MRALLWRGALLPLLLHSVPARAPYPKSRANSPSRLPLTDPQRVVARALSRSALSDVPATSLLAEVPQGEPRARLLRAAIELTDPRQWRAAIALLRAMPASGAGPPTTVAYNLAMRACVRGGAWETALELAPSGGASGVEPTVQCYGAAIAGCASRGEWRPAIALLREAQAASHQASEHRAISGTLGYSRVTRAVISQAEPLVPSIECYNAALAACEKGGAPDRRACQGFALLAQLYRTTHGT
ncbi:hypothetical protein EMIHUDRAFT_226279 [Emiliania huxleyi CCMP1516]|uniref:Pentacotripeptide-repeat region of PRORP domain-containing protein n=2 Tax=Emiliania huxleyi TaxID=2903 RepID=A0A0D3KL81_EMIH1|nr:hypothetical protein EMIHUDRAFT_226279 [Emiliania huxleyi CCMP1516]EOD36516.1 hypothetical protein EMIHUDRAFT_226279 [Emiliania huxleyi CCMP1516]|eukprot:XP_005788945.1 hypothetical protein EMIHUDRAFT_226279 [Emiliania huxleyi CCMP1516]